jgi:hypothetical protein
MTRTGFWSSPNAHLRCSDEEREQIASFLRDRAAEGRLTPDELDERVGYAYRAVTMGDLYRLVADLPGSPFGRALPRRPPRNFRPGVVAAGVVALIAVLMPGPLWLLWIGGVAVALGLSVAILALGLTLGPFVLAGAAAVYALRRIGGRGSLRPPAHGTRSSSSGWPMR